MTTIPFGNAFLQEELLMMAQSYRPARLLLSAVELGVFEAIHAERLTAAEVAARIDADGHATAIVLDALAGLGLLDKLDDTYGNVASVQELLHDDSAETLFSRLRHQSNSWQDWSVLTDIVKHGFRGIRHRDDKWSSDFAGAMRFGSKQVAERLDLMMDFSDMHKLCDLGCGPSAVSLELLHQHPHLQAVLVDRDAVALSLAERESSARNLLDRVRIVKEDIFAVQLEERFDMLIMSLVLCLFSREDALRLMEKAKGLLKPGGVLILGEVLMAGTGRSQATAALFAIHLLVTGARGGLFSLDEIRRMLAGCGLSFQRNFPTSSYHIIVGKNEID